MTTGSDPLYAHLYSQHVDLMTNTSTLLSFAPDFNPFSNRVADFAVAVRAAIGTESRSTGLLYHPTVTEYDAEQFTLNRLPWVLVRCLETIRRIREGAPPTSCGNHPKRCAARVAECHRTEARGVVVFLRQRGQRGIGKFAGRLGASWACSSWCRSLDSCG